MQISFDPLAQQEAAAVRAMLDALQAQQVGVAVTGPSIKSLVDQGYLTNYSAGNGAAVELSMAEQNAEIARLEAIESQQRAAPLDPAPSTAAADLFSTAPAAPQATSATIVPAPPVPSAPIPPAPSASAASASPAGVDSTGLPWDERIHSGTKAVNADGTWRARRGLNNPALVKEVEAELRKLAGIPVSAAPLSQPANTAAASDKSNQTEAAAQSATVPVAPAIPTPPIPSPPIQAPAETVSSAPITTPIVPLATHGASTAAVTSDAPNAATTTSAPPTAPIPSPPASDASQAQPTAPVTFGALMTKLAKAVNERRITAEQVDEIVARHGIPKGGMGQLVGKPDLVQLIDAETTLLGA